MIDVKRVRLWELESLVFSPDYAHWQVIPISRHRASSYINNPRAVPSDVVLYLAFIDNKLVGYRTVMPDSVFVKGKALRVGWLSGNWVDPTMRRQGIASQLFELAFNDWDGRLLFTNYALESKAVYDKSGKFQLAATLHGQRFYLRPCLEKLISHRRVWLRHFKVLLRIFDALLSIINVLPLAGYFLKLPYGVEFEYCSNVDKELRTLFEAETETSITKRTSKELDWILRFPWLVSSPFSDRLGAKYNFSSAPKKFDRMLAKVFRNGKLIGFFLANSNDGFISIPYISYNDSETSLFAKIILKHAITNRGKVLTIFNQPISNKIKRHILFGLFSLKQERNYFVSQEVFNCFDNNKFHFLEGDGDCAFI